MSIIYVNVSSRFFNENVSLILIHVLYNKNKFKLIRVKKKQNKIKKSLVVHILCNLMLFQ